MASALPSPVLSATAPDHGEGDGAYYRRILHELIAYGADVAKALHGEVLAKAQARDAAVPPAGGAPDEAAPRAETVAEVAEAFERVSRGVRRAVALARRLDEPVAARPDRAVARQAVIRGVEDRIRWAASLKPVDTEGVEAEFAERMDLPDMEDQIGTRPVAEIVDEICHDLGLSSGAGHKRRRPVDIEALWARASRPGGGGLRVVADALLAGGLPQDSVGRPANGARVFGANRFRRE